MYRTHTHAHTLSSLSPIFPLSPLSPLSSLSLLSPPPFLPSLPSLSSLCGLQGSDVTTQALELCEKWALKHYRRVLVAVSHSLYVRQTILSASLSLFISLFICLRLLLPPSPLIPTVRVDSSPKRLLRTSLAEDDPRCSSSLLDAGHHWCLYCPDSLLFQERQGMHITHSLHSCALQAKYHVHTVYKWKIISS